MSDIKYRKQIYRLRERDIKLNNPVQLCCSASLHIISNITNMATVLILSVCVPGKS